MVWLWRQELEPNDCLGFVWLDQEKWDENGRTCIEFKATTVSIAHERCLVYTIKTNHIGQKLFYPQKSETVLKNRKREFFSPQNQSSMRYFLEKTKNAHNFRIFRTISSFLQTDSAFCGQYFGGRFFIFWERFLIFDDLSSNKSNIVPVIRLLGRVGWRIPWL